MAMKTSTIATSRSQRLSVEGRVLRGLETAIRTVHAGSRHIPAAIAERLVERMAGSDLTSREMEVLELIVRGQSNKEIGASLRISEATVKSHINNILSKLGVTDRTRPPPPPATWAGPPALIFNRYVKISPFRSARLAKGTCAPA